MSLVASRDFEYLPITFLITLAFLGGIAISTTQNIWIHISTPSMLLKLEYSTIHYGHVGLSICATHVGHAPPFLWDKVLLGCDVMPLPKPHDCENVRPKVT